MRRGDGHGHGDSQPAPGAPHQGRGRGRGRGVNMVLREVLFALALALTTYDALQNSPPKVSRTPTAGPFFGRDSMVTDWYKGQLSPAMSKVISSEVSFVMYYAPWDAESQHVRHEFEKAARIMFKQIHFCALNCWNPSGECRLVNNKITTWPILIAYVSHPKSVTIYTGPKDAPSMVRFARRVLYPVRRANDPGELAKLSVACDAIVAGFVPFADGSMPYEVFYGAALKSLEYDPHGDVCFVVVTSESLASELGVLYVPSVKLFRGNETSDYPSDLSFDAENVVHWVRKTLKNRVFWHSPSRMKSFFLRNIFRKNPVLILFTPRDRFGERTPQYDLLREVASEYDDCGIDAIVDESKALRRSYAAEELATAIECEALSSERIPRTIVVKSFRTSPPTRASRSSWKNETFCGKATGTSPPRSPSNGESNFYLTIGTSSEMPSLFGSCQRETEENVCRADEIGEGILGKPSPTSERDIELSQSEVVVLNDENDPWSPTNLKKRFAREKCVLQKLSNMTFHRVFPEIDESEFSIRGLGCGVNNSLTFIAIDSLTNYHFAESLGIDILNAPDRTAAVILYNKQESQYLLRGKVGERSLRDFVYNFTNNFLSRHLRMKVNGDDLSPISGVRPDSKDFSDLCDINKFNEREVCIHELNTSNFHSFVMQRKAILVVFCSRGSGPCGGLLTLSLMSASHLLKGLGKKFQVGRIDASINDLPWEYTVSTYPTLVFFPPLKKEESRSYPENQPFTIEGVLAFVMAGFDPPLKLHAQLLLCNQTKNDDKMKGCLMKVRYGVGNLISCTLKSWRRAVGFKSKGLLLRRLNILRNIAIHMGALNTIRVPETNPNLASVLHYFNALENLWNSWFSVRGEDFKSPELL